MYLDLIGSATRAFQWTPGACCLHSPSIARITHYLHRAFPSLSLSVFSLFLSLCLSVSTEDQNSMLSSRNFYWLSHLLLSPLNNDSFLAVAEYLGRVADLCHGLRTLDVHLLIVVWPCSIMLGQEHPHAKAEDKAGQGNWAGEPVDMCLIPSCFLLAPSW